MVVDYLSSQPNRAGYQVSTKQGSGPSTPTTPTQSAFKKAKSNPRDTPSQTHILTLNPKLAPTLVMQQKDREGISTFPVCIVRHQGLEPRTR